MYTAWFQAIPPAGLLFNQKTKTTKQLCHDPKALLARLNQRLRDGLRG
jgi:hypothetical protein